MTTGTLHDRRGLAQDRLAAMAGQGPQERLDALRDIIAGVLGFTRETAAVTPDNPRLPAAATVIGSLSNRYGPDYVSIHFDMSGGDGTGWRGSYVTNAAVQAANGVAQRYAGDERYPLLVFTLPGGEGVQFVTGNPEPSNRYRLRDVARVSAYWQGDNRTALDCLERVGRAIVDGDAPQRAFATGFDVQPVTSEFFDDYKAAYNVAVQSLAQSIDQADAEQFAQTLFNRLMFIHFVSKKGWLRFNGDTDYLNALWRDYQANTGQFNFYTERLTALFFAGLNNPQSMDLMRDNPAMYALVGDVPFLNGGLFERNPLDRRAGGGEFAVPDTVIEPLLTGLFNRYNFTVMEATPLDTEVAVDPEMLGKLFEETVNERHGNGAYYTPRPVVAFMCREAIKGYLLGKNITRITKESLEELVDERNSDAIDQTQAEEISAALRDFRVVDPACGSGAFLLGMLQEIVQLNESLYRGRTTPETRYEQKLRNIANNIHGTDKDGLAVNIAMLRLWLSLAVDYEGDGNPKPLPNLDLKLVTGDAVAGPCPQAADFLQSRIDEKELRDATEKYTNSHGTEKAQAREKVEEIKRNILSTMGDAAGPGIIEWRMEFAEAMSAGGFDAVIGNPPYVRQEEIKPDAYKTTLLKLHKEAATKRSDLYCHFYSRGMELLKEGGLHLFICSNSWLDVGYGAKLQEHLLKTAHVEAIYESAVERQFQTADINTVISVIRKQGKKSAEDRTKFVSLKDKFDDAVKDPAKRREITKTRAELTSGGRDDTGKFVGDKWGGKYLRAPDIYHTILSEYGGKLVRLGDVATVRFGIKTGANDFFCLTPERIAEFNIEPKYCRPVMTTPQESRSIAVDPARLPKRLFLCHDGKDALAGTGALAYIQWGEAQGYHRGTSVKSRKRWYDLGERETTRLAMNYLIDTTARTFLVEEGLLFGDNFQELRTNSVSQTQLCAALNSTLSQMMFNIGGRANFGGGLMKIQTFEIEGLQIVNPALLSEPKWSAFNAADWDVLTPSVARRHVDGLVYDALGLTPAEREAVQAGVAELVGNRKRRARSV